MFVYVQVQATPVLRSAGLHFDWWDYSDECSKSWSFESTAILADNFCTGVPDAHVESTAHIPPLDWINYGIIGGSRGGAKGAEAPLNFFQIRFLIDGSRHRNIYRGDFLDSL